MNWCIKVRKEVIVMTWSWIGWMWSWMIVASFEGISAGQGAIGGSVGLFVVCVRVYVREKDREISGGCLTRVYAHVGRSPGIQPIQPIQLSPGQGPYGSKFDHGFPVMSRTNRMEQAMSTHRCKHELVVNERADCGGRSRPSTGRVGVNGPNPAVQAATGQMRARNAGARDDAGNAAEIVAAFLPGGFLHAYERVIVAAYGTRNLGSGKPADLNALVGVGRRSGGLEATKTKTPDVRGGAAHASKSGGSVVPIRSERAWNYRAKVDRRIRQLGRDMVDFLASLDDPKAIHTAQRRCAGRCGKFGDGDWNYCARCGGPMREAD